MSSIAKKIDNIIKAGLAPFLKNEGFKKKARNFYREHENRIEVINVQSSKWNEGTEGNFTLNIGVYYPEIAQLTEALPVKGLPKEYECTVSVRVGLISKSKKDTWWEVNASSNEEELGRDLAEKTKEICIPWLTKMSNLNEVKTVAANNNKAFIAAAIALHQGNKEEARTYLEESFKQQPLAVSKAKTWGIKQGIIEA